MTSIETGMPIKDLLRRRIAFHAPVIHRGLGDQCDGVDGDPLPENDIVGHGVRLHLAFHLDVENLQGFLG